LRLQIKSKPIKAVSNHEMGLAPCIVTA